MESASEIGAIAMREIKKWYRSPILLFMTTIQPLLWMSLYGKAFNLTGLFRIPEDILNQLPPESTARFASIVNEILSRFFGASDIDFFSYISVGMMGVILLFTSMSSGMSIAWDRRLGFLNKLLVAPIRRSSIVFGKIISSVVRGVAQSLLVMLIGLALGLRLRIAGPLEFLIALAALAFLGASLSALIIAVTVRLKSWESHIAVSNLLTLPLMFTSSALYPVSLMPDWLRVFAVVNPLTHGIELLRQAILLGAPFTSPELLWHLSILTLFAAAATYAGIHLSNIALRRT
ncbi:MAG: ABC transporter permease [Nitrososphaerota archaeon]|nr:ABC transporter permease [Candidatus Calditenuaceae archaeon]MDW8073377.1 ABC transporter permease [Nitrososphaerota archaeon]